MNAVLAALALIAAATPDAPAPTPADYLADARELPGRITDAYAYRDHWPAGVLPHSAVLDAEREGVHDRASLLHYAGDVVASLADHHAITLAAARDDWALVPSYADLWIEGDRITAVRRDSPAAGAGIVVGDRLQRVAGEPLDRAIDGYWARLGLAGTGERRDVAARVLAAGRRDRVRVLTIEHAGHARELTLPTLYAVHRDRPPVTATGTTITINDSLGEQATIAAFDAAVAGMPAAQRVTIDLTETPSGGNTSVARAMMGWFVRRPVGFQIHNLPSEERETGIARQWVEQVLPRAGKFHPGGVTVLVGRWTGSMGEGLAIGFAAVGARVCGGPMAGLKGAVTDLTLPRSGLRVKVPSERLYTVAGVPREQWVPSCRR